MRLEAQTRTYEGIVCVIGDMQEKRAVSTQDTDEVLRAQKKHAIPADYVPQGIAEVGLYVCALRSAVAKEFAKDSHITDIAHDPGGPNEKTSKNCLPDW